MTKLIKQHQKVARDWKAVTGFPLMYLDEVKSGEMTFAQAFSENVTWIEHLSGAASNLYKGEDEADKQGGGKG